MKHELRLKGHRFSLRPVERADAEFILSLRNDPQLGRYLHPTSPQLADQLAWMEAYEQRPGDYYFIVCDERSSASVGTIAIYDIASGTAEWGRWLIRPGSLGAVESALLIHRVAFEHLLLGELYCRTMAGNLRVLAFHDSLGALRRQTLEGYAVLADGPHDAVEHFVTRELWQGLRPQLERLAARVAEA